MTDVNPNKTIAAWLVRTAMIGLFLAFAKLFPVEKGSVVFKTLAFATMAIVAAPAFVRPMTRKAWIESRTLFLMIVVPMMAIYIAFGLLCTLESF